MYVVSSTMIAYVFKLVLVSALWFNVGLSKKLPDYFPVCHQNDPMLSDCIKNATNTIRPYLIEGIPELGIAGIEPLVIPMIKLEQGTKKVNYKAMLRHITIRGLSSYDFKHLYVQTDMFAINGRVVFGKVTLDAEYFIIGRILKTAIQGMGLLSADLYGTSCDFIIRGQVMHRKGTEYYSNFNTTLDIKIQDGQLSFDNLFDGDKTQTNCLKICHRSDPKLNDCIKRSVEILRPLLKTGIPELGIPSCEPLVIPEIFLDQGTGAVSLKSIYRNVKVYGPSNFTLKSVKIDFDKDRVRLRIWIPNLHLVSDYKMEGRILMMPISGVGKSTGNYTNIDAMVSMQGEKVEKSGKKYFNVKDFYVSFNIGHAHFQLDDLFNGDKELGEAMNLFLNENWKTVASDMKPVLEDTIATMFKKFANKIYHKYPIDELLPP